MDYFYGIKLNVDIIPNTDITVSNKHHFILELCHITFLFLRYDKESQAAFNTQDLLLHYLLHYLTYYCMNMNFAYHCYNTQEMKASVNVE